MNSSFEPENQFCLDTNAFIEPWHRRYPIDVFPSFWDKLETWGQAGIVFASEEVLKELSKVDDGLFKWAKSRRYFFKAINEEVQEVMLRIMAKFPRLVDTKKGRSIADPWVIAHAKILSAIVVTEEKPGHGKSPKIPDVCESMKIPYTNLIELIRTMKLTF